VSKSAPWKDLERRHAKRFAGGERLWRPDFSESAPDGQASGDVWDAKCYQRFSVVELFVRCERKYREFAAGRRFHLCLFSRDHPRAGDFVLVRAGDYADLVASEERLARLLAEQEAVLS
jgi:hypothetical protein